MKKPGSADVPVGNFPNIPAEGVGAPDEWHTRGYLPHRDRLNLLQSVTFRLADSLPQSTLRALEDELASLPDAQRDAKRRRQIEFYLDAGMGCCALAQPKLARYVQEALLHFHGERYTLHAWCIMPNHVHVLLAPSTQLAQIVQGWKSFTARWALAQNESLQLGIPDPRHVWMREYWDRYIRDRAHYEKVVSYIHHNPVKAGLCRAAEEWQWSSAFSTNEAVLAKNLNCCGADGDVGAPREL